MQHRLNAFLVFAASLGIACLNLSGCAASRALDKPAPKNYGVLKPGTNRDLVRAELGQAQPSVSKFDCDVFAFEHGSSGWKYMRAIGYSLLDIGTLGVSEVVANPAEAGVGKDKERVRVCYDKKQDVMFSERMDVGKAAVLLTGEYPPQTADTFTVSGGISGLSGSGLTLALNGLETTTITDNGAFAFNTGIASGQAYAITVQSQPVNPSQTCGVAQGSGTVTNAKITNVSVSCAVNAFSVFGQISGLKGSGMLLQNNGSEDLAVIGNGPVKFPTKLNSGTAYNVTILSQPAEPDVVCEVTGGTGIVGSADVTSISINCQSDEAPVAAAAGDAASVRPAAVPATASGTSDAKTAQSQP